MTWEFFFSFWNSSRKKKICFCVFIIFFFFYPLLRYHNIGQVGSHPLRYNNGDIELVYENGEPCQSPNRKNSSTHIKFVCDMNAEVRKLFLLFFTSQLYSAASENFIWIKLAKKLILFLSDSETLPMTSLPIYDGVNFEKKTKWNFFFF